MKKAYINSVVLRGLGIGVILLSILWFFFISNFIVMCFKPGGQSLEVKSNYQYYNEIKNDFVSSKNLQTKYNIKPIKDSAGLVLADFHYGLVFNLELESNPSIHRYAYDELSGRVFLDSGKSAYLQIPQAKKNFSYFHYPSDVVVDLSFKREIYVNELRLCQYSGEYIKKSHEKKENGKMFFDSYDGIIEVWFACNTGLVAKYEEIIKIWGLDSLQKKRISLKGQIENKIDENFFNDLIEELVVSNNLMLFSKYIVPVLILLTGLFILFLEWVKKEKRQYYHKALIGLLFFGGLFISILFYLFVLNSGQFLIKKNNREFARSFQKAFESNLDKKLNYTENVKIQFLTQENVEADEFEKLAKMLHDNSISLKNLMWVPESIVKQGSISDLYSEETIFDYRMKYHFPNKKDDDLINDKLMKIKDLSKIIASVKKNEKTKLVFAEGINESAFKNREILFYNPLYKENLNGLRFIGVVLGIYNVDDLMLEIFNYLPSNKKITLEVKTLNEKNVLEPFWSNHHRIDGSYFVKKINIQIAEKSFEISFYSEKSDNRLIHFFAFIAALISLLCSTVISFLVYKLIKESDSEKKQAIEKSIFYELILKEKSNDLNGFVFMVSNELKIPIIRSLKALEVLKSKLTNYIDFSVLDIIKDLNSNLSKRIEMIDGLLNYALLGDKKEVSWVSMQKEVEKLILDFKKEFDRRNTVITFDTLPGLRASTFEIHLLLKNMLFWFVKKTPENKSPRIHINVIEEIDSWKIGFESISIQVNQSDFDPFITKLSNSPEHLIYFSDIVQMQKILNSIDGIFITELMERQGGVIWIIFKKNEVPISKMF